MKPAIFFRNIAVLVIFLFAITAPDIGARLGAQLLFPFSARAALAQDEAQSPKPKGAGQFSASGVGIQLIDMIAGPLGIAGAGGLRDGRLDLLLDKGAYKLRVFGATGAAGKVRLSAEPFQELETKRTSLARNQKYGG